MSARFEFTLTGIRPLLMHVDAVEWGDTLKAWQTDPDNKDISKAGDDRSPAWTWLGYLPFHDVASVPSSYISGALRDAGKTFKVGKGNKTYKQAAVSGVWLEAEFFPIVGPDGKPYPIAAIREKLCDELSFPRHLEVVRRHGFNLDMRRAKVNNSKHVRIRPRFDNWKLVGTLEVPDTEALPAHVLTRLFEIAGKGGIGDYRPSAKSPGPFGVFSASLKPIK